MGGSGGGGHSSSSSSYSFHPITNQYKTLEEVQNALRAAGLESSNLVLGIDYTKSNEETGKRSFGGRCLHSLLPGALNPYQQVISIVARTLSAFDDDGLIPVYGFGDQSTGDRAVFPFNAEEKPCNGLDEVLRRYTEITPKVVLYGPTSFAPLIYKTLEIVRRTKQYHILVIIADGQVNDKGATARAIVEASRYPMSIVMVGVGDGPWEIMKEFDDGLSARKFDNFQFVPFNEIMTKPHVENYEVEFAINALTEIPGILTFPYPVTF
ncbi:E3 ubiquitin-protein ligase RGLG2 [Pelomyxa schiedti]|nr:E3 ubiquitin-protein ligase RGLG2 [Pelomyxa schiedti]